MIRLPDSDDVDLVCAWTTSEEARRNCHNVALGLDGLERAIHDILNRRRIHVTGE
jgi:hypothetical protein